MMGKSPMMKKLIGKQENLPEELKAKILASPAKKYGADSPMEQDKAKLKKATKRKPTDREVRISKNKEFNTYAEKQGWKPPQPTTDKEVASYTEFYKNKTNVNRLNKKQAEYFKNKK